MMTYYRIFTGIFLAIAILTLICFVPSELIELARGSDWAGVTDVALIAALPWMAVIGFRTSFQG